MSSRFGAAAGVIALLVALVIPANAAYADGFRDDQWYLKTLKISQAHRVSKGAGISVAVVDTGVYPHPDIRRNLLAGTNLATGSNRDGHRDEDGHGTGMAGIIAAHGKSSRAGVLGIAPAASILPVKITNRGNSMPADTMASGILWASEHGAKIINVSAETGPAFELVDAVQSAIADDIVVVAGVGNKSKQAIIAYPAAIDGVLVVGSVDRAGKHASFSVNSPKVQICAPGVDMTTADTGGKYVDTSGTSASTAIVSGAAALVRSRFPSLSATEVVHRLVATVDDVGPPGRDDECGFGMLNLVKALTADVPPLDGEVNTSTPSEVSAIPSATALAQPKTDDSGSSAVVVFGGLAGVAVAVGVLAFLSLRRRRNF